MKSGPAPPLKQVCVEPLAQNHVLVAFEDLQAARPYKFPGSLCQFLARGGEVESVTTGDARKKSFKYLQKPPQLCGSCLNCLLEAQEKMSPFKVMIFASLTCSFGSLEMVPNLTSVLPDEPYCCKTFALMGKYFILAAMCFQFFYLCKCLLCLSKILYNLTGNILWAKLLNLTVIRSIGKLWQLHWGKNNCFIKEENLIFFRYNMNLYSANQSIIFVLLPSTSSLSFFPLPR